MDFRVMTTIRVDLTTAEFRLISKALRGAPMGDEELQDAQDLQVRMLRERHASLQQMCAQSQKAIDNIDAAEE